jgi:peptidyl-tRNA hydrolase
MREFEYKQVLIFRKDLQLSKGKVAAQAGHAAAPAIEPAPAKMRMDL